jgi:hypothetical protein
MKRFVFTCFILALLFVSGAALANPPCPQVADRLEDFAVCMRPFANGRGQVLVGSYYSSGMDHHTAGLMNSMHRTVSAPQVYPTTPPAVSLMSNMAVMATATYRMPYPYNYWMLGNPYMWMGTGMPIYYPH